MPRITFDFMGPEDPSIAAMLEEAEVGYARIQRQGITGLESVELVVIASAGWITALVQVVLQARSRAPHVVIHIDNRRITVEEGDQIQTLLIEGSHNTAEMAGGSIDRAMAE